MLLAAEESAKCKAAKEVIKSLTAQVFSFFVNLLLLEPDVFYSGLFSCAAILFVT